MWVNRPHTSLPRSARGLILRLCASRAINPYSIPSSAERYCGDSFARLQGDCCKPDYTTTATTSTVCSSNKNLGARSSASKCMRRTLPTRMMLREKDLFSNTSTLTKSGTSAHAVASPAMCASRYLPPLDVLPIQRSLRCPVVSRHPSSAVI